MVKSFSPFVRLVQRVTLFLSQGEWSNFSLHGEQTDSGPRKIAWVAFSIEFFDVDVEIPKLTQPNPLQYNACNHLSYSSLKYLVRATFKTVNRSNGKWRIFVLSQAKTGV
jgi:hypothetical protein